MLPRYVSIERVRALGNAGCRRRSLGVPIPESRVGVKAELSRRGGQERFEVRLDGLRRRGPMIAALQATDQPTLGVGAGHRKYLFRQADVVFGLQPEVANRVEAVGIKAGADQHQLRPAAVG